MNELNENGASGNTASDQMLVEPTYNGDMNSGSASNGSSNVNLNLARVPENSMNNGDEAIKGEKKKMPPPEMTFGQFRLQHQQAPTKQRLTKVKTPSNRNTPQPMQVHHEQSGAVDEENYAHQMKRLKIGNPQNVSLPQNGPRGQPLQQQVRHPSGHFRQPMTHHGFPQGRFVQPGPSHPSARSRFIQPPLIGGQNPMQNQMMLNRQLAMQQMLQQQQQHHKNQMNAVGNALLQRNLITNMKFMQSLTKEKQLQLLRVQEFLSKIPDPALRMAALQQLQVVPSLSDDEQGGHDTPQATAANHNGHASTMVDANGRAAGDSRSFGINVVHDRGSTSNAPRQHVQSFMCKYCKMLFLDHASYRIHMGIHAEGDPFRCNLCNHVASDTTTFYMHKYYGVHNQ